MPSAEKQSWSLRRLTVSLQALCLCQGEHPTVDVSFRPEGNGWWVWPLWSLSSTPYSNCYLPALPDQESGSVQLVLSGVCLLIVFSFSSSIWVARCRRCDRDHNSRTEVIQPFFPTQPCWVPCLCMVTTLRCLKKLDFSWDLAAVAANNLG